MRWVSLSKSLQLVGSKSQDVNPCLGEICFAGFEESQIPVAQFAGAFPNDYQLGLSCRLEALLLCQRVSISQFRQRHCHGKANTLSLLALRTGRAWGGGDFNCGGLFEFSEPCPLLGAGGSGPLQQLLGIFPPLHQAKTR